MSPDIPLQVEESISSSDITHTKTQMHIKFAKGIAKLSTSYQAFIKNRTDHLISQDTSPQSSIKTKLKKYQKAQKSFDRAVHKFSQSYHAFINKNTTSTTTHSVGKFVIQESSTPL